MVTRKPYKKSIKMTSNSKHRQKAQCTERRKTGFLKGRIGRKCRLIWRRIEQSNDHTQKNVWNKISEIL